MTVRMLTIFTALLCLAPEEGAGSGGAGAGGGGGAGAGDGGAPRLSDLGKGAPAGQGQQAAGQGQPPAGQGQQAGTVQIYRPDGLTDDLLGKSDQETIDRLLKQNQGFRSDMSKRGEVPKDVAGYALSLSDKLSPYVPGGLDNDPLFKGLREDALATGLTAPQFQGFLDKVMTRMVEGGMMLPPFDAEKEYATLVPAEMAKLDAPARKAEVQKVVETNMAFLDTQAALKEGGLPMQAIDFARSHLDYAGMHQMLSALRAGGRERGFAQGGSGGAGGDKAAIEARLADPRGQWGGPKYDAAFAAETYELQKRLLPQG